MIDNVTKRKMEKERETKRKTNRETESELIYYLIILLSFLRLKKDIVNLYKERIKVTFITDRLLENLPW